jgi:hypothetical protein
LTASKTALLIHFDEDRRRDLIQSTVEGTYDAFSDALSVYDWDVGRLSVAILCFSDNTLDYIALAKKGKRVVTSKFKVDFSSLLNLQQISVDRIESRIPGRLKPHFIKASQGSGKPLPDTTWGALIAAIKAERPVLADDIDRILSLRRYSGYRLTGPSAEILAQERDALGISLDIFSGSNQLRERVLTEWAPDEGSVEASGPDSLTANLTHVKSGRSTFLAGIPQRYLQEESAIQHDLLNWPGMTPIHEAGISHFEQGGRKLSVIYANRNDLEHTLGVDLIYYNEIFELFVLVQYKLMKEEHGRQIYRPDAQLTAELSRMNNFYNSHRSSEAVRSHNDYRLSDDGFFVKVVPNKGLTPASGELIRGLYLPREYLHFLLGPSGPKGAHGGGLITFDGAPRHLTNSQFSASVHSGWIGTRGVQSQTIKTMVKSYYETGKALVIAVEM